jgi:hypothetical protein
VLDGGRPVVVGIFSGLWAGRASELVVLFDVVVNEGFDVELSHVVVVFLDNGTSHEAC